MIKIQNITKSFGDKVVLNDVSGVFEKGKPNLIIGASGTGKSVLLKYIVGLVKPDDGQVFYDGRDFYSSDRDKKKLRSDERWVCFFRVVPFSIQRQ